MALVPTKVLLGQEKELYAIQTILGWSVVAIPIVIQTIPLSVVQVVMSSQRNYWLIHQET